MNHYALRLFVRSLIAEAKDKKTKEEPKKSVKKEAKAPKSSGKLVDLKKELAALRQYKNELEVAKFAEKTASTEVEFADLAQFAKELNALKERGVALEKEVDDKIKELETRISDEKNKIKEMMGLVPEGGQKKIVDEKKKPIQVTPDNEVKADKDLPSTTEAKKMTSAQKDKKEDIVKGMKKSDSFGKSKDEKSKMYATATKLATKKK
jgi:hypothetical protein